MRDKSRKALLDCGMQMNQSGFLYIVDAMELFEEHGAPMTNMGVVYGIIGKRYKTDSRFIIENIHYSLKFGRDNCRTGEWDKYFGLTFTPKTIGNCLASMYMKLKEEE